MEKSDLARLRLSPDEKRSFQQAADLVGMSLSAWMRITLRNAAAHQLAANGTVAPFYGRSNNVTEGQSSSFDTEGAVIDG